MRYVIGLIGYGYWGPTLLKNFIANDRFQVKYVCDRNICKLKKVKEILPNCILSDCFEPLLQDRLVDIIVISTQAKSHYKLTLEALRAGKHVFVEKPLCLTTDEAKHIVAVAKEHSRLVWVDHTFMFTSAYIKLKSWVKEGKIGQVLRFHSTRVAFGLFQQDVNVLWHLMYHDAYLILDLFQLFPTNISVNASAHVVQDIEDSIIASYLFSNGLHATFLCDLLFPAKKREIILSGDKGIILWDETKKEKLLFYSYQATHRKDLKKIEYNITEEPEIIPLENKDALTRELDMFADYLDGKIRSLCDADAALKTIYLLEATQKILTEQKINA